LKFLLILNDYNERYIGNNEKNLASYLPKNIVIF